MGLLMIIELHDHCWVWWWKNFENRSTFAEVIVHQVGVFFLNTQYSYLSSLHWYSCTEHGRMVMKDEMTWVTGYIPRGMPIPTLAGLDVE